MSGSRRFSARRLVPAALAAGLVATAALSQTPQPPATSQTPPTQPPAKSQPGTTPSVVPQDQPPSTQGTTTDPSAGSAFGSGQQNQNQPPGADTGQTNAGANQGAG